MHATLRDRLATLLDYAVPVRGWQPVSPCASGTVSACFEAPDSYEHLAPVTWFGTARLLVLCGTAQAVLMLLALVWDLAIVATARWYRSSRAERDEDAEEAHTQYITLDCLDVALSGLCVSLGFEISDSVVDPLNTDSPPTTATIGGALLPFFDFGNRS